MRDGDREKTENGKHVLFYSKDLKQGVRMIRFAFMDECMNDSIKNKWGGSKIRGRNVPWQYAVEQNGSMN